MYKSDVVRQARKFEHVQLLTLNRELQWRLSHIRYLLCKFQLTSAVKFGVFFFWFDYNEKVVQTNGVSSLWLIYLCLES